MTPHPHQETADGFTPMRVELPLDYLEAFRLASFGIEYQPRYGEVRWDEACAGSRMFGITADRLRLAWYDTQTGQYSTDAIIPTRAWQRLPSGL